MSEAFPAWKQSLHGQGLFAIVPLSPERIRRLWEKKIFLTEDGRINLAGIPLQRLDEFVGAVRAVQ